MQELIPTGAKVCVKGRDSETATFEYNGYYVGVYMEDGDLYVRLSADPDVHNNTRGIKAAKITDVIELAKLPVQAGPYGHWYAWHDGELLGVPMERSLEPTAAPAHPATLSGYQLDRSGWYATEDVQGGERRAILAALGVLGEELAREASAS